MYNHFGLSAWVWVQCVLSKLMRKLSSKCSLGGGTQWAVLESQARALTSELMLFSREWTRYNSNSALLPLFHRLILLIPWSWTSIPIDTFFKMPFCCRGYPVCGIPSLKTHCSSFVSVLPSKIDTTPRQQLFFKTDRKCHLIHRAFFISPGRKWGLLSSFSRGIFPEAILDPHLGLLLLVSYMLLQPHSTVISLTTHQCFPNSTFSTWLVKNLITYHNLRTAIQLLASVQRMVFLNLHLIYLTSV